MTDEHKVILRRAAAVKAIEKIMDRDSNVIERIRIEAMTSGDSSLRPFLVFPMGLDHKDLDDEVFRIMRDAMDQTIDRVLTYLRAVADGKE